MTAIPHHAQWDDLLSEAHVWHMCPYSIEAETLERQYLGWLTPQEKERRGKLLSSSLRHDYLLSRVLCRATLSHYSGIDPQVWIFGKGNYGKPAISSPVEWAALRFNLTHTEGLIACAVTRAGEVGIDAENLEREIDVEGVARLTLSHAERLVYDLFSPEQRKPRLFEYWVLKEAYLKAIGIGLWKPLAEVMIDWDYAGRPLPIDGCQLTLHRPGLQHVAAVAVRSQAGATPITIKWRDFRECYKLASPS